jgi:hypothetical protein
MSFRNAVMTAHLEAKQAEAARQAAETERKLEEELGNVRHRLTELLTATLGVKVRFAWEVRIGHFGANLARTGSFVYEDVAFVADAHWGRVFLAEDHARLMRWAESCEPTPEELDDVAISELDHIGRRCLFLASRGRR